MSETANESECLLMLWLIGKWDTLTLSLIEKWDSLTHLGPQKPMCHTDAVARREWVFMLCQIEKWDTVTILGIINVTDGKWEWLPVYVVTYWKMRQSNSFTYWKMRQSNSFGEMNQIECLWCGKSKNETDQLFWRLPMSQASNESDCLSVLGLIEKWDSLTLLLIEKWDSLTHLGKWDRLIVFGVVKWKMRHTNNFWDYQCQRRQMRVSACLCCDL